MDDENENRKQQQKRTSDMTGFNFVFFFCCLHILDYHKNYTSKTDKTGKYIQRGKQIQSQI